MSHRWHFVLVLLVGLWTLGPVVAQTRPASSFQGLTVTLEFDGRPWMQPVKGIPGLQEAVNTRGQLLLDLYSRKYFLLVEPGVWYQAWDAMGPFGLAGEVPVLVREAEDPERALLVEGADESGAGLPQVRIVLGPPKPRAVAPAPEPSADARHPVAFDDPWPTRPVRHPGWHYDPWWDHDPWGRYDPWWDHDPWRHWPSGHACRHWPGHCPHRVHSGWRIHYGFGYTIYP